MNSISKTEQRINGHRKKNSSRNRHKNHNNQLDEAFLPADKERLRRREEQLQRDIRHVQKQLQTDLDLVKSPKGRLSSIGAHVKETLVSAEDSLIVAKNQLKKINSSEGSKIQGGLRDNFISAKEHIMRETAKSKPLKTKVQPTSISGSDTGDGLALTNDGLASAKEQILGVQPTESVGLIANIGDKVKDTLVSAKDTFVSAKDTLFTTNTREGSFVSAEDPSVPAEETSFPANDVEGSFVSSVEDTPVSAKETYFTSDALRGSLVFAKDGLISAKERIFGTTIQPIEGGMPGRNHPHPERFEVKSSGLMNQITGNVQDGLIIAKSGLLAAKDRLIGSTVEPIESGMPGRNHPHPERFEVQAPGLVTKVSDNLQDGFGFAKEGLFSAKKRIFGAKIQPIEGGMPGRNHPHPERFEAKAPGLITKMSDNLQSGFVSAKDGLVSAKNMIWGQTIHPVEGGMPGRYHPHPERFEVQAPGISIPISDTLQGGFASVKDGLFLAKNKIWRQTIQPIEGGMPGRNHPHPERFEVKAPGLVTKISDNLQGGFLSAKDRVFSAKNMIWKPTVQPIEGGMPGRYHPHPERFEAKSPDLITKISDNLQSGFGTAKDGLFSAKKMIGGQTIQPVEGGMPGRNHPHPERFEAKVPGLMTQIGDSMKRTMGQHNIMEHPLESINEEEEGMDEKEDDFWAPKVKGSLIEKESIDWVNQTAETENHVQRRPSSPQPKPQLSKLVSETKLAELFDINLETDPNTEIADQTSSEPSSEPSSETVKENMVQEKPTSPKQGFLSTLRNFFSSGKHEVSTQNEKD
jgi:hypothetical protein